MSKANRASLDEQASTGLNRREIHASLTAREIDFDPRDDIETLAAKLTVPTYESRDT